MSIADKLQTILENEQKVYNAGYEKGKSEGGGGVNKLAGLVDGTPVELTAEDLAGATKLRDYAFYYGGLTSVAIPDSVTSIGSNVFFYCRNLTSVVIPDSVTSIGDYVFGSCSSLTSIEIPDSVTSIGKNTFSSCSKLTSVEIGRGVTSISRDMFRGCSSLTSIEIPNSITFVADSAFNNCKGLKRVDFSKHTSVPTLQYANVFNYAHADLQIKVPANLIDEWKSATNWSDLASKIVTEFTNEL